jgi:hypothetical protein
MRMVLAVSAIGFASVVLNFAAVSANANLNGGKDAGPVAPFVLDDDGKLVVKLDTSVKKNTHVWVKARTGTIVGVSAVPEKSKVTWQLDAVKNAIAITVARDATEKDAKEYTIRVAGKDGAGMSHGVTLKFKVAPEPFALDDDGKLEVKLDLKAGKDTQVWVMVKTGTFHTIAVVPPDSKVTWKFDADRNAIAITVAKEAGIDDAKEYSILVFGKDTVGKRAKVQLKFKVTLPTSHHADPAEAGAETGVVNDRAIFRGDWFCSLDKSHDSRLNCRQLNLGHLASLLFVHFCNVSTITE